MKRIIEPQENVEYVFRFPPKKVYTYRWYGDMHKGRVLLYNVTRKYYTAFTPQYFTFLQSNHLVSKTVVQPNDKPIIEEPAPTVAPSPAPQKKTLKEIEEERERSLNEVKPLDADSIKFLQEKIQQQEIIPEKHKNFIKRMYQNEPEAWPENIIKKSKNFIVNGCSDSQFGSIIGGLIRQDMLYQKHRAWFDDNK